jgi:hypothetical protein
MPCEAAVFAGSSIISDKYTTSEDDENSIQIKRDLKFQIARLIRKTI